MYFLYARDTWEIDLVKQRRNIMEACLEVTVCDITVCGWVLEVGKKTSNEKPIYYTTMGVKPIYFTAM